MSYEANFQRAILASITENRRQLAPQRPQRAFKLKLCLVFRLPATAWRAAVSTIEVRSAKASAAVGGVGREGSFCSWCAYTAARPQQCPGEGEHTPAEAPLSRSSAEAWPFTRALTLIDERYQIRRLLILGELARTASVGEMRSLAGCGELERATSLSSGTASSSTTRPRRCRHSATSTRRSERGRRGF
jgi:hypothetical protein